MRHPLIAGGMNTNIGSAMMNGINMEGRQSMMKACK